MLKYCPVLPSSSKLLFNPMAQRKWCVNSAETNFFKSSKLLDLRHWLRSTALLIQFAVCVPSLLCCQVTLPGQNFLSGWKRKMLTQTFCLIGLRWSWVPAVRHPPSCLSFVPDCHPSHTPLPILPLFPFNTFFQFQYFSVFLLSAPSCRLEVCLRCMSHPSGGDMRSDLAFPLITWVV